MLTDSITNQTLPPTNVVDNDGIVIRCTNVNNILETHVDYWNGIRYDYMGDLVDSSPEVTRVTLVGPLARNAGRSANPAHARADTKGNASFPLVGVS